MLLEIFLGSIFHESELTYHSQAECEVVRGEAQQVNWQKWHWGSIDNDMRWFYRLLWSTAFQSLFSMTGNRPAVTVLLTATLVYDNFLVHPVFLHSSHAKPNCKTDQLLLIKLFIVKSLSAINEHKAKWTYGVQWQQRPVWPKISHRCSMCSVLL